MLEVGKVVGVHGLNGEMKVQLWCDGVDVFKKLKSVHMDDAAFELQCVRANNRNVLIKLKYIDTIDIACRYKNKIVSATRKDLGVLPRCTYYIKDLLGIAVVTAERQLLGNICDVIKTGSNDVYVIKPAPPRKKLIVIPALKDIIKEVNIVRGFMTVELPDGLLEL